jgi:hypothetical protein
MLLDQRAHRAVIASGDLADKLDILLVRQVRSPSPNVAPLGSRGRGCERSSAAGQALLAAELLQALFDGLGLGLELGQVRLELGDHLGLAPEGAVEPVMSSAAAATAVALLGTAGAATLTLATITMLRVALAVAMMPSTPAATALALLLGPAALTLALMALLRVLFAAATMSVPVMQMAALFASLTTAAHDQPLFRRLTKGMLRHLRPPGPEEPGYGYEAG